MVCIYCGSDTQVTNSRHNKRINSVWRRRACKSCGAVFTSHEAADLAGTIMVQTKTNHLEPFQRDNLFISIYESCKHRFKALEDATALTQTAIAKLIEHQTIDGIIPIKVLTTQVQQVLHNFDPIAGTYYGAYYAKGIRS